MNKVMSILFIVVGLVCIGVGIYPLFEVNQEVKQSIEQWEELKNVSNESMEEDLKTEFDQDMIGMMKISSFDKLLPIREGITETILKKGVGLDMETPMIGSKGNSVFYGHREEIFWNLKHVEVGELITIETLDTTLTYEITEIKIVNPDDEWIYESSEQSTITLVTCYPFIYMGPTPERYVVKASLK